MGLESATYIHQLNPLNPVGAVDPKAQGDDHLRLIKSTVQATFPNITGAVTATQAQLNGISTPTVPANKVKGSGAAGAGTAVTVLHSDAQLLLDLADAYAWTGQHSWTLVLQAPNGTVGAPAFTFASDLDLGWYRVGANLMGLGAAQLQVPDGVVGVPIYSFTSDPDTGFWRSAANQVSGSAGGAEVLRFDATTGTFFWNQMRSVTDGTVSLPAYSWNSDPNTGIYRVNPDEVRFAANGVLTWLYDTAQIRSLFPFRGADGAVGTPTYSWTSETNTGLYFAAAGQIGITLAGTSAGVIAQGTFTGTLTGYAANPTGTVNYQRVGSHVMLWLAAAITGTSNANTLTMTGLPAIIRPSVGINGVGLNVTDNGFSGNFGAFTVSAAGVLTISNTNGLGGVNTFTTSGTKGIPAGAFISYPIT